MQFTAQAIQQLNTLFKTFSEKKYFRVYIMGGGCSGFQYEFAFLNSVEEDDHLESHPELSSCQGVAIDPISYEYLEKATLDYQRNLSGARFVIINPKEQRVCGCGFSVSFE